MKVMVGAVGHESNTFTPLPTLWEDFHVAYGADALRHPRGSLQGIVQTLQDNGVTIVPTVSAHALPGGLVEKKAFENLKNALLAGVPGVDGICIFLHGAMRADGVDYGDTAMVEALRQAAGPDVPIVVAMDMHANVTASLVENANAIVTYRTAPHVDTEETGKRAAKLLLAHLRDGVPLAMGLAKIPILMAGEMAQTAYEPMASLIAMARKAEENPHVLAASIVKVHCWADVPDQGVSAVVVTNGDAGLAHREANRLATAFWERRAEFRSTVETYEVDEAIDVALAAPQATVFLSDSGDNPGAGGTTDVPFVLERLLAKGVRNAAIAAIWDEEAVSACLAAGVGETVSLTIGGKKDTIHGKPLAVAGRVRLISDGRYYREGVRRPDNLVEQGTLVVLEVGGVDVLLSQKRVSIHDTEQMRAVGMEPLAYKIVVLKRGYLEPRFQEIAERAILTLSPGATNCDVTKLEYRRVNRPVYPLDPDATWTPKE